MGSDLQNILKIQRLTNDQIQALIYQVLRGLKVLSLLFAEMSNASNFFQYIHSAGIVHRDLKPSNIAVNEVGEVKVICIFSNIYLNFPRFLLVRARKFT